MSLIAREIKELRELLVQVKNGDVKPEHVRVQLGIYKETHKRVKLYLDMYVACGSPVLSKEFDKLISKDDVLNLPEK